MVDGAEASTGARPSPGGRLIPRPGGSGERGAGLEATGEPLLQRPHPGSQPLTLRAAATRRSVPGPTASHFQAPPASSSRSAGSADPGGPGARAASAFTGRSPSGGRPFPGQRRRVSAARWQSWLRRGERGAGRGERGPERSLPLLAGGGGSGGGAGRQAAAAADAGVGALTRPEGPAGPCVPREEAAAARAAGRLLGTEPVRVGS